MKILTISDLHGRTSWRQANFDEADYVVFLGDYTDSYFVDDSTIYTNLQAIIELKRTNPDKFVLLIGNHDAQYLHFPHYRCSGFRNWAQPALSSLFAKNHDLFQVIHQQGTYLFSHAGITNQWFKRLLAKTGNETLVVTPDFDLAELLNDIHWQSDSLRDLLFEVGPRRGGSHQFGGPIWADRSETRTDYLIGFHQVVGHTPTDHFLKIGDEFSSITYTDILQTQTAFHEVIIPD